MNTANKTLALFCTLFFSGAASAHSDMSMADGFTSGLLHPILGPDHVLAMVAVGLWGAILGRPAIWLLPVVFPLMMAFGGVLGVGGIDIPAVETGIAASALVLGVMVAIAARPPLWLAGLLVAAFAIFHGHAHGTELPSSANPLAYSLGFVISTGILHLCGILFGELRRWSHGLLAVKLGGALIALGGAGYLVGVL